MSSSTASRPTRRPRLVVFDLDGTLWDPEMYQLWGSGGAPFTPARDGSGDVEDRSGTVVHLLGNSRALLADLTRGDQWKDTQVGVASSTDEPDWAEECMQKIVVVPGKEPLMMKECIQWEAIRKGNKRDHFKSLQRQTGVAFEDMVFFDNERRNITAVQPLGVTCVYVPQGMTTKEWDEGLRVFAEASTADAKERS